MQSPPLQHRRDFALHLLQLRPNLLQRIDRQLCERTHGVQIRLAITQNLRHVLHARHDFPASRRIEGRRFHQSFQQSRQRLVQIKGRVALPPPVQVQLPTHTCQR